MYAVEGHAGDYLTAEMLVVLAPRPQHGHDRLHSYVCTTTGSC